MCSRKEQLSWYLTKDIENNFMMQADIRNFLRLKSCVLYTELENLAEPLVNVEVVAHVAKPELRSSEVNTGIKFY